MDDGENAAIVGVDVNVVVVTYREHTNYDALVLYVFMCEDASETLKALSLIPG